MSIEIASLLVSFASLVVSLASAIFAKDSLFQAKEVASRAATDWKQQQWFALFLEVNAAYDLLDRVHSTYYAQGGYSAQVLQAEIDAATLQMKKAHGLAMVFPKCLEINALCDATKFFAIEDYFKVDLKERLLNASEGIRKKALVSPEVIT